MTAVPKSFEPPPVQDVATVQLPASDPENLAVYYDELQPAEKRLLRLMEACGGAADEASLAEILRSTSQNLQTQLRALAVMGLVQPEPSGSWQLSEAARRQVVHDLTNAVHARLVTCAESRICASPPGNPSERVLRRLCRHVFSPHSVRPRVPLRQVLDVQLMNGLLDEPDRRFLANATVRLDLVVEHVETEEPLLALEFDGPQHGRSLQLERDARKDRILRVSGLMLLRLWINETEVPEEGTLRTLLWWQLSRTLRDPAFLERCPPALQEVVQRLNVTL